MAGTSPHHSSERCGCRRPRPLPGPPALTFADCRPGPVADLGETTENEGRFPVLVSVAAVSEQLARRLLGALAVDEGRHAVDDDAVVARGLLDQPPFAGGVVEQPLLGKASTVSGS